MKYRYHLLKYAGPATRFTCPSCGKPRCFTPYVDENDEPADIKRYGICDHINSCGYVSYPSSDYRKEICPAKNFVKTKASKSEVFKPTELCTIPEAIVKKSLDFADRNNFITFLNRLFPQEAVQRVLSLYKIGTMWDTGTVWDGGTIFYEFDKTGRCRSGKIIRYNPETGHRIKDDRKPSVSWLHTSLLRSGELPQGWTLSQCLFGEHLLTLFPDKPVALVEAEKTAVICAAAFPDHIWLATGGRQQFNDRLLVLKGRSVKVFPDIDAYPDWRRKAKGYAPLLHLEISPILERLATPEQREAKIDIADLVVEVFTVYGKRP